MNPSQAAHTPPELTPWLKANLSQAAPRLPSLTPPWEINPNPAAPRPPRLQVTFHRRMNLLQLSRRAMYM